MLDTAAAATRGGLVVTGRWDSERGLNYSRLRADYYDELEGLEMVRASLRNKTLRVATLLKDPFLMLKHDRTAAEADQLGVDFEDLYEGYAVDLMRQLRKQLGFRTDWHMVYDRSSGVQDEFGHWSGAMKELIDKA